MATVNSFEELRIWQEARKNCKWVSDLAPKLISSKNYRLKDQIEGSSGSVMDNIAEGFERTGKKEFINFLIIAKGSAGEYRSQLYRLLDCGIIDADEHVLRKNEAIALSKQIANFIKLPKIQ